MAFIIVIGILVLDQASKFLASQKLLLYQSMPLVSGIFHLTLVHNRGAAFGILRNQLYLFIFTSICAIILIGMDLKKHHGQRMNIYALALCFILAGALGNLIDRLRFGYVVDFLDFRVWPVFNVADSAITVGAVLLGWSILRSKN